MAKTYTKAALGFGLPGDSYLEYSVLYSPEAASETFLTAAPVKWASGYITAGTSVCTALTGFSLQAGSNVAAGAATVKWIPCYAGLKVFGNFLGAAAADNVLAAADLGTSVQLALLASTYWYFLDDTNTPGVILTSFESDQRVPNNSEVLAVAGDTNARLTGEVLASVNDYLGAD